MKNSLDSFIDATHTFYAAETGVEESLIQLKKGIISIRHTVQVLIQLIVV